jgi:hypothetical protein
MASRGFRGERTGARVPEGIQEGPLGFYGRLAAAMATSARWP